MVEKDEWVWMPDEVACFLPAKAAAAFKAGDAATLITEDGVEHEVAASLTVGMAPVDPQILDKNISNLISLNELSQNGILHNLRIRFLDDDIYTFVSSILISVNPFKMLEIFTPEKLEEYKEHGASGKPPHIWSIADSAYRAMVGSGESQAVIISGESGAGKTEATKLILQYVAEVSGKAPPGTGQGDEDDEEGDGLEQQILQANPVMEALGNAKTMRNNNSSRFGKLIQIDMSAGGAIVGGSIINYLLEKSRVVWQQQGERNYHVFYQVLHSLLTHSLTALLYCGATTTATRSARCVLVV